MFKLVDGSTEDEFVYPLVQVHICSSSWDEVVSSSCWVQGILYEGVLKEY